MRVAVGGIWHETNTFAAATTPLGAFEVFEGETLRERFRGTKTPIGGFLDGGRERGFEIVPTLFASATPSGTVERAAYDNLLDRMVARMVDARPDALLLDLHGAMVVEGIEEVEAHQLGRLRERLGSIPIGGVLDFHANISHAFVERIDVFAGYDTYPHVDPYDRGVEVARMLAGTARSTRALIHPPLLTVPQAQRTDASPMRDLLELAHAAEKRPGVLSVTVAGGFPYADVPHAGLSVAATTDNDPALARSAAEEIARAAWESRDRFRVSNLAPAQAVERALRSEGPVVLVDQADNIGGGSPGDGTALLDELLKAKATGAVVAIADAEVVAQALQAGVGRIIETRVGGKADRLHGPPVPVRAKVARIGSGDFNYKGSYMTGRRVEAGLTAVLEADGVRIVVREKKVMPFDAEELRVVGIEPRDCRIIVVKSALAWKAAYGDIAKTEFIVDTPGICTARLETLPYRHVRRPVWPLDPEAKW
jgi:microcystin degradation protein MlrC